MHIPGGRKLETQERKGKGPKGNVWVRTARSHCGCLATRRGNVNEWVRAAVVGVAERPLLGFLGHREAWGGREGGGAATERSREEPILLF